MASPAIVDVALVLAVDVSTSVDSGDYALQTLGIARALREPDIFDAISSGAFKAIALSLVQWSTHGKQSLSIPWRVLQSQSDLELAAQSVEQMKRDWRPGGTGLAAGLQFSAGVFDSLPW